KGPIYGVGLGILVTSVLFVYNYSHTNFVRHQFTLRERRSITDRPVQQLAALRSMGTRALIFELQGYLFFGTSTSIVTMARSKYEKKKTRCFVFDFRMVQGIDASAVNSFVKLAKIFHRDGAKMVCCDMRPDIMLPFRQAGVGEKMGVYFKDDLDHGLEWIEEQLLADEVENTEEVYGRDPIDAPQMGQRLFEVIQQKCETLELKPDQVLLRAGDPSDGMYFVEEGTLSVFIRLQQGHTRRLRTLGPGSLIGEMSLYTKQPRSADAVAVTACRLRRLSIEGFEQISRENNELSNELHVYIVKLLAFRLSAANAQIAALA
ncbi:MAG: cyclic nucleotide-binding domain-containing protein, partial [Syntrophales bacterium LBB04]|nr:cyclic nucleotide-binding domain-containing protein [Syntrophales bacterium LBB04]